VSDWYFTSNPLQGIGGLELPQHDLIDPGLWRAAHLPASIGPTVAMTFLRRPACGNHMLAADPPADGSAADHFRAVAGVVTENACGEAREVTPVRAMRSERVDTARRRG